MSDHNIPQSSADISAPLPELLCPAGDMDRLDTALLYGANACYLGGTALNLRAGTSGFTWEELGIACNKAHEKNARIYFTLNLLPHESHLSGIEETLDQLASSAVDGIIIADPGVMRMARNRAPHKSIHLSTQANTANSEAVLFWKDLGIERVNVARELGASKMRALRNACPDMELEVFVHGAMCLALSGRCLLSAWLNNRPANLGECTHPCRFEYKGSSCEPKEADELALADMRLTVEERQRPDAPTWDITREEPYSALWSPDDLCLIKYLRWFANNGIHSLKIEGRMKTPSYVAHVVDAYRTALDDIATGQYRLTEYLFELQNTASRRLSTGFFLPAGNRIAHPLLPKAQRRPIVAQLVEQVADNAWRVAGRSPWQADNDIEIMIPGMKRPVISSEQYTLENHKGEATSTLHPGTSGVMYCDNAEVTAMLQKGVFVRSSQT